MSRVGQCPSCHAVYELDDDAIGQVMDCSCGDALFICDIAGFREIPVACRECGGEYVVDQDGAGEVVECECGEQLTVPSVVLRRPLASPGVDPKALLSPQANVADTAQDVIECPKCGEPFSASRDDVGDEAQCRCGCVFLIDKKRDGTVFAQATDVVGPVEDEDRDAARKQSLRRKQPVSLFSILGIAAVSLLLLVSIVMFVTRDQRHVATQQASTDKTPNLSNTPATGSPASVSPNSDSFRPPVMKPLAASGNSARELVRPIPDPGPEQNKLGNRTSALLSPPPEKPLPKPKQPRAIVPIVSAGERGLTFERAYAEAFQAYEETLRLKQEAAKSKDNAAYHQQLGETLGLMQQTLDLATRQGRHGNANELRYLLAYLHFTAGRLAEASVLGEMVARTGDVDEPATLEAAMIALAASQEANETGWGVVADVGELDQMALLADIIAERWPDHQQLDLVWMDLGQRYDAFGRSLSSANAYARVAESSPRFADAQLSAGAALWAQYRRNLADGLPQDSQPQKQLLQRAEELVRSGVKSLASGRKKPTAGIMAAKLSLARMAMISGQMKTAESWLVDPPLSVVDSIVVSQSSDLTIQMSEGFVRSVFETLFSIRSQRRDAAGAKAALEMMAGKVGGDASLGKQFLGVARDYIDQLVSSAVVTREQFSTLSELIEPLKQHESTLTVPNVLWLGESWSRLAEQASSPELAKQCYAKAAAAYALAMNRSDFPAGSRQAALIRRAELLRGAGDLAEVIPLLESILKQTPNAFAIQIEAAETLQQLGLDAGKPEQLAAAIDGPGDATRAAADSAIWGWSKLVTTLYALGSSDEPNDPNQDRLLKCQYHLAKCQWLLAQSTSDAPTRERMLSDCQRSLKRLLATTSPDREPWYTRLQQLHSEVTEEK